MSSVNQLNITMGPQMIQKREHNVFMHHSLRPVVIASMFLLYKTIYRIFCQHNPRKTPNVMRCIYCCTQACYYFKHLHFSSSFRLPKNLLIFSKWFHFETFLFILAETEFVMIVCFHLLLSHVAM